MIIIPLIYVEMGLFSLQSLVETRGSDGVIGAGFWQSQSLIPAPWMGSESEPCSPCKEEALSVSLNI